MKDSKNRRVVGMMAALVFAAAASACAQQSDSPPAKGAAPTAVSGVAAERFKQAGKGAPLTVLPTSLAGTPMPQVGEAVAMLLERGGMTELETSAAAFAPPEGADLSQTAAALSEFVRANPPASEFALFTAFMGSPKSGVSEVRAIVVTSQGEVAWQDRQAKGDADFDRIKPSEPLQCCVLVVERLRPVLGLSDPMKNDAPSGKVAQRWEKSTGIPDRDEQAAIEARGKEFRKVASTATVVVYPAHVGAEFSVESGRAIAEMINGQSLMKAVASDSGPRFEIAQSMNEQKTLWSMARGLSEYVRANPPEADFVLFADYLMGGGGVGGVHFAICDRRGELVVVDFQNSHWADFKSVNPRTREDCDWLVLRRLKGFCQ